MDIFKKYTKAVDLIKKANSQPEIKKTLDKYFCKKTISKVISGGKVTKISETTDSFINFLANFFDIDYKTGVDHNLASDGKYHDFGKGKFSKAGDNIPMALKQAKAMVIKNLYLYSSDVKAKGTALPF